MPKDKNKKVIVAMSGGVDSSVAAALLKKQGFDVIGVFMKFWSPTGSTKENRCCTPDSEKRARLVAKKLGIPFYVYNFEKEFKKRVVDYFLKTSKKGDTPNPCVVCNKDIKFGLLLDKALKLGADYVATGHYAQIKGDKLLMAKDKNKDQSYFLWQLNQKQLKRVLFPVGKYTKTQVRALAKKFKLPTADTPESMEVCFVNKSVGDFLSKYLKKKPGNIIDVDGNILGRHQGLWFYTIGQRKGIGIASKKPYYVLEKNIKKNELIVTQKDLFSKELTIKDVKWISGKQPLKANVKIRYRSQLVPATIYNNRIVLKKPQRAITPGQSAVFYIGRELIGGGIIDK